MEHLKDNVARTKLFLWKKAQTPEKVVTPREQTQSYTVQDSTPVTITGHREAQQHLVLLIQQQEKQ